MRANRGVFMKIVISLGGSLVTEYLTPNCIEEYAKALLQIQCNENSLFVVVGAGSIKKKYIDVVKGLGLDDNSADTIAIEITRLNALLISMALKEKSIGFIPRSEDEILSEISKISKDNIFVCGGTKPGQSTDSVAALIASKVRADIFVNASNVSGVYDCDPKKNLNAKKIDTLTYDEFAQILDKNEQTPGKYFLFDRKAVDVVKEHNIKLVMIDGSDPEEIIRAVQGVHSGTVIGE